jgi:crotonobetainyl-CoA:carnitine CoA-transferase CaiB-like acyl-CoA transferase
MSGDRPKDAAAGDGPGDGTGGRGPLAGLRVLDIATIIAAPLAATLLADYGADVLKIEMPGRGDGVRTFPPFKDGQPLWWKTANRNKKFATLDLRTPEGVALFRRMLPRFDVLIENFRPGTLDRWGLTKEVLWSIQPRLVILRATAFGQSGPYRSRPGFARIFEAMGGLTYLTGEADGEPTHPGYPIGDAIGGLFGAMGVLAALWKRARDPAAPGEEIDLALTEAVFRLLDVLPIEFDQLGFVRGRIGNANGYSAPAAVFRTRDARWVTLAGSTNVLYAANCRAIDRPDLIDDPRFASNDQRVKHAAELNGIFSAWCAAHTLDAVLAAFAAAEGTIAPIYAIDQIADDPQARAREMITRVPDRDFGSVAMANVVPRFTVDPARLRHAAGSVGQDNAEVYQGWLGLSPAQLETLCRMKVI